MRRLVIALLKGYRLVISPMLPQSCRYYPSCSSYAVEAVETHGVLKGSWLAARRLGRCHPWTPGGVDHVPGSPREQRYLETSAPPSTTTSRLDAGARPPQGA